MEEAGMVPITLTINGTVHRVEVYTLTTLLITLREHLGSERHENRLWARPVRRVSVLADGQ